jgi:hypothetical protein
MLVCTTSLASPTDQSVKEDKPVKQQVVSTQEKKDTKVVQEDRVSASQTAKISNEPTDEMKRVSAEMEEDFKEYKKSKSVIPAVAAVATVGALYVGSHNWHDLQNKVGVDRVAHFGVSYIICDQLQRNFGMNKFWACTTTIAIGAGKEKWVDNKWDGGDFAADCAGAMLALVDIKF